MKLLSAQQIHEWDAFTIANEPVGSLELMERAAWQCTQYLAENDLMRDGVKIFCGKGNNGGDGLAIARQLCERGIFSKVYILEFGAKGTDDFQANLRRLHNMDLDIHFIQSADFFPVIDKDDLVIDALFGSGLNRPLEQLSAELVGHINKANAYTISIDVPSGMFTDKSSKGNTIIHADTTLTFQCLKLCFLVAENATFFGEVRVMNIELHPGFLKHVQSDLQLVSKKFIQGLVKQRPVFAHKGNFGHALLIAGEQGKTGAAILAAKACLRTGAGLVTVHIPVDCFNAIHSAVPEAMCTPRNEDGLNHKNITVIAAGPGIGMGDDAVQLVNDIIHKYDKPVLLDADAISIISNNKEWLAHLKPDSVLTPHPKEFERLFGAFDDEFARLYAALDFTKKYPIVVVLKGHHTLIACNGKGWLNTTGNSGLAKGGSGDTLTGMVASLMAQGYSSEHAAIIGVYLHGLAANLALQQQSPESLLATDVIENIGAAFYELRMEQV